MVITVLSLLAVGLDDVRDERPDGMCVAADAGGRRVAVVRLEFGDRGLVHPPRRSGRAQPSPQSLLDPAVSRYRALSMKELCSETMASDVGSAVSLTLEEQHHSLIRALHDERPAPLSGRAARLRGHALLWRRLFRTSRRSIAASGMLVPGG